MTSTIKEISKKAIPILRSAGVKKAAIFGSFARGEERVDSDIDLLVEFRDPKGLFQIMDVKAQLTKHLGRHVDLLTSLPKNPYIRPQIEKDLITLLK
ncbi:MAG: nucleotidyltransferase family protein [Candidatus Berkelbacteria bacterium]|nr:nucleotidyltransferase family protein [Candidatus Berkelbacteria bacterium]